MLIYARMCFIRLLPALMVSLLAGYPSTSNALTQRVANTTLAMPSARPAPESASYSTSNAFPGLTFTDPVALATPPGETNRLFVVEQDGLILVITNLAAPTRSVFLNMTNRVVFTSGNDERGLLGLAFHPNYASNRHFFVFYTATGTGGSNRVSRFTTRADNAHLADTNSEVIFISQFDDCSNHNGGDVHFGPDGYLYVSLGDEGGGDDNCNGGNSQRIDKDFFSAILRIDVDKNPGSLPPNHHPSIVAPTNYAIPPDNPFIGATQFNGVAVSSNQVRTEFWAVGLRNPYRMSFDEVTGDLYVGDVGQGAREEVDLITRGGNYGWKWREGFIATPSIGAPPAGFTNYIDPILDYPRSDGYSVTGGRVYRGDRFPELVGRYIFCDYGSGNIWSLTNNGTNVTTRTLLANDANIACFGVDPRNGDLLMGDRGSDDIRRLVRTPAATNFPQTLTASGVFSNPGSLNPHAGIIPYELNVPFWSDNAAKRRWFSVPSTNLALAFSAENVWGLPTGTVWIKHFELELTSGVPSSARRIETRLLIKTSAPEGGYGVTYRWGDSTNEAYLVLDAGLNEQFVVDDGGTIRTQTWRYPSRSECLPCHNVVAGFALGFNTPQLNRDSPHVPGGPTNQLVHLASMGYFNTNFISANLLRALPHPTNDAASLESRARAYLQANCSQCHFPGGPTPASFDTRLFTPLSSASIVDGALVNTMSDPLNRVLTPNDVVHSMIYTRIALRGAGQMPPLASSLVDTQGVALLAAWIGSLGGYQIFAEWQLAQFGSTNAVGTGPFDDFDGDGAANRLEYLTGTQPTNPASAWGISATAENNGAFSLGYERIANRGFTVQASTDLVSDAWTTLDLPGNQPFYASSNAWVEFVAPVSTNEDGRYYRIRVEEP